MAITKITLRQSDDTALFDGTHEQDRAGIDIPASVERYNTLLKEQVERYYADGAPVEWREQRTTAVVYADDADGIEQAEMEHAIQRMAEDLFNDGSLWMVDAE